MPIMFRPITWYTHITVTAYSDRYFFLLSSTGYSASGFLPQPIVYVLLNLVIAHITYDFIHNYVLNSRFVMQDGIIRWSVKSQKTILLFLISSTSDSSSYYTFQCVGLSQRLFYCHQLFVPHPPSWLSNKDLPHVGWRWRMFFKWFWISGMSEVRSSYPIG